MAFPNGGLITETNRQYYAGSQGFQVEDLAGQASFTFTFDTNLVLLFLHLHDKKNKTIIKWVPYMINFGVTYVPNNNKAIIIN
mgnify:CR=1 FL=1